MLYTKYKNIVTNKVNNEIGLRILRIIEKNKIKQNLFTKLNDNKLLKLLY